MQHVFFFPFKVLYKHYPLVLPRSDVVLITPFYILRKWTQKDEIS